MLCCLPKPLANESMFLLTYFNAYGDQAGGIFRYVLTGDPTDYCRALAAQERFTALRAWKNRVLHGRRGEE